MTELMPCNIWQVRGPDYDPVINTGMGLNPSKNYIVRSNDQPLKAITPHFPFDYSGSLHEFDWRLSNKLEAEAFAAGGCEAVLFQCAWTEIDLIYSQRHGDPDCKTFTKTLALLTGYTD